MIKICTVTGSRAEFFILKKLISKLQNKKIFSHYLLVTGSHNSKFFGKTINDIKKENISISGIIDLNIRGDKASDISKYFSLGVKKFSKKFLSLKPDLLMVLGDRYEIFSATIAAYLNHIPIVHIYGGETTQGSLDEGIRHSITKLSNIHFVSTKKYFDRVKQLGENPSYIFNVGSMGVESIKNHKIIKRNNLEKILNIKFDQKNILMTFHPETTKSKNENIKNLKQCLNSLRKLKKTSIIITMPGADHNYKIIYSILKKFSQKNKNVFLLKSLGHDYYFSICRIIDFMIGNSSSGIIEMPSFSKPTINLGNRQLGRIQAKSVLNVDFEENRISHAIKKAFSARYIKSLSKINNPYEKNNSSDKILKVIKTINLKKLKTKKFFDYKY